MRNEKRNDSDPFVNAGKAKLNMLAVVGALLLLGTLAKLIYIGSETPTSREIEESMLITKDLKLFVCGVSFPDPRIHVDPCGNRDVRFRAVHGLTTINVYGVQRSDDFSLITQRARKALSASDLSSVELVFKENLESADSRTMATIRLNKETGNANR